MFSKFSIKNAVLATASLGGVQADPLYLTNCRQALKEYHIIPRRNWEEVTETSTNMAEYLMMGLTYSNKAQADENTGADLDKNTVTVMMSKASDGSCQVDSVSNVEPHCHTEMCNPQHVKDVMENPKQAAERRRAQAEKKTVEAKEAKEEGEHSALWLKIIQKSLLTARSEDKQFNRRPKREKAV